MQFQILGSSSAGNCSLVQTANCRVLLDAGFSGKKIMEKLEACGLRIEDIDAVLLTHEHSDHCSGVRGLSKYKHLRFVANRDTAMAVARPLRREVNWQLFESGARFSFHDLDIQTFSVPHDAYDPVGYVLSSGTGDDLFSQRRSVAWLTDLGYIPEWVKELVAKTDLLVLEANHDCDLLERDEKRPFRIKNRIRSRHGHLSNDASLKFLNEMVGSLWRHVYLAHLSRDCNSLELVEEKFLSDAPTNRKFTISPVDPVNGICSAHQW